MVIRKLYKVEGAHIVRNCTSRRCSESLHGHSAKIEIFLTSDKLDSGGMVVDFGLLKGTIHDFIDSFDHSLSIWNKESDKFIGYQTSWSDRWIKMPVTPSAENYALMFLYVINKIICNTEFNNSEGNVKIKSVRYHETDTGYAEAFIEDLDQMWNYELTDIKFSDGIKSEWKTDWYNSILSGDKFINPIPTHQVII